MTRFELPGQRTVNHLTLHRQKRRISRKEYQSLSADERLTMIRAARGKEKYDLILDAPDAEELVPALHPQEIYLTVNEMGAMDAVELLSLVSADQLTTLLDLDCWQEDELSADKALHWLQLLVEAGDETVCRIALEMEPEILALLLKKLIRINRGPEAYDDDDAENANRLEGLYDIEYRDAETHKCVGAFLELLMHHQQPSYLLLMEMVRGEIGSALEEEVFQARNNRLLDLGFDAPHEARALYTYIDPDHVEPQANKQFDLEAAELQHPGALLALAEPEALLADLLAQGIDHHQATELALLANRKMSADRVDMSDPRAVAESLAHLYRTLNLGLEQLVTRKGLDPAQVFSTYYLQQVFQIGHSLTERLHRQAKNLLRSSVASFFDSPFRRFLETLAGTPPRLYAGNPLTLSGDEKDFQTHADLLLAEDLLQQITIQQQLFNDILPFELPDAESLALSGCQPDSVEDLTLSDLFLTALANQLLGHDFKPQPIPADALSELHGMVCANGQMDTVLRKEMVAFFDNLLTGAGQFAEFCLEIWQEEFCALKVEDIDPRFVRGLIVKP